MRIFNYTTLRDFWETHPDSKEPLIWWYETTTGATWRNAVEVKTTFRAADILSSDRVVFDIKGNKYRVIASVNYEYQAVYIKFIGTHAQYDRIDANTVDFYSGGSK